MIDMHVHLFPPAVFRAIWRHFESESKGMWRIHYKLSAERHMATLRAEGVRRFTTLVYAHKAGLARQLNDYVHQLSLAHADVLPFGTVFAGDNNVSQEGRRIFEELGFFGLKLHPFVSRENIDEPKFFPLYELMEAKGKVLVCHPGSGPVYDEPDGASRLERVLQQFPRLRVVVAHCGAYEYGDYESLADKYEHVHFDTAMNCVHGSVFRDNCPGRLFFERHASRIVFGTDFPNIPYEYVRQTDAIRNLALGPELEQRIFRGNAEALLGLP